jgi:hypothetical protein
MSYVQVFGKNYILSNDDDDSVIHMDHEKLTFSNEQGRLYLVKKNLQWVVRTYLQEGGLEETTVHGENDHRLVWNSSHLYYFGSGDSGWSCKCPGVVLTSILSKHHVGLLLQNSVLVIYDKCQGNLVWHETLLVESENSSWKFVRKLDLDDDFFMVYNRDVTLLFHFSITDQCTRDELCRSQHIEVPCHLTPVPLLRSCATQHKLSPSSSCCNSPSSTTILPCLLLEEQLSYLPSLPPMCRPTPEVILAPYSSPLSSPKVPQKSQLTNAHGRRRQHLVALMALSLCTKTI